MRAWVVLAVLLAGPVWAQDVDCSAAETQTEMTFCAEQDWNAADADLNEAYQGAMAYLKQIDADLAAEDRGGVDFLRQAQRDWISFRDNACAAEAFAMHGGSAEPMVTYACRARLTRERAEALAYISDYGN
ncbi:MAG: DUF1311 domain-containing protein [Candidatus Saccharibacteria bacterium]|nr:DUF1311 domain-containing protein [Pseudorhodobacter sp.]